MWLSCIPETNVSRTILTVIVALFLIIQLIVANVINAGFRLLLIYSGHVCRAPDRECTLLFLQENICEYWLEAPLRGVYNTYPQNKFSLKNGKTSICSLRLNWLLYTWYSRALSYVPRKWVLTLKVYCLLYKNVKPNFFRKVKKNK